MNSELVLSACITYGKKYFRTYLKKIKMTLISSKHLYKLLSPYDNFPCIVKFWLRKSFSASYRFEDI